MTFALTPPSTTCFAVESYQPDQHDSSSTLRSAPSTLRASTDRRREAAAPTSPHDGLVRLGRPRHAHERQVSSGPHPDGAACRGIVDNGPYGAWPFRTIRHYG